MASKRVEQTLRAMADANKGRLTPDAVVLAARSKESPLHDHFTWDDAEAAEAHRIDQARALIASCQWEVRVGNATIDVPVFVRDPEMPARQQGYIVLTRLGSDADAVRDAVIAEFAAAAAALKRARHVAIALGLHQQVDALVGQIVGLQAAAVKAATPERRRGKRG